MLICDLLVCVDAEIRNMHTKSPCLYCKSAYLCKPIVIVWGVARVQPILCCEGLLLLGVCNYHDIQARNQAQIACVHRQVQPAG